MIKNILLAKKYTLLTISLDIFIISYFLITNRLNLSDFGILLTFIILLGYILGKYNFKNKVRKLLLNIFFKIFINSFIYLIISYFFDVIFSISIFKYEILLCMQIGYFTKFFIDLFLEKIGKKKINKYIIISSKEFFNKFKNIVGNEFFLNHFDIDQLSKIEINDLDKESQIIFYPENAIARREINKFDVDYIDFSFSEVLFEWCNNYLYKIPVDLFDDFDLQSLVLNKSFPIIDIKIKRLFDVIFSVLILLITFLY